MKNTFILVWLVVGMALLGPLAPHAFGQVGIGTSTPNAQAALEITASDKGLLIPRLTAAQRVAIAAPPQGLMVYQTDGTPTGGPGAGFWYYAGTGGWVLVNPTGPADNLGNHTATQNLNLTDKLLVGGTAGAPSPDGLKIAGTGRVGVGLGAAAPAYSLDVNGGQVNTRTYYLDGFLGLTRGYLGSNNIFVGTGPVPGLNSTGDANTVLGQGAAGNLGGGVRNTAVGVGAGYNFKDASHNTAIGYYAGYAVSSTNAATGDSDDNTFVGYQAAQHADATVGTTVLGAGAGLNQRDGDHNTFLGNGADLSSLTQRTNATAIGYQARVNQDNTLVLGASGANAVRVGIGTPTPNSRLSLSPSATEAKITLWDNGSLTDHYGFGVSGGQLNYHVSTAADAHVFSAGGKNGDGTELARFTGAGRLGLGTAGPFSQLANTATNVVGADGYGVGEKSLTWSSNLAGYAGAFFNANAGVGQNGLAVKVAGANAAAIAFDVSQGPTAATAGVSLLTVRANGLVGIRSSAPAATLEVRRGTATDGTAAFWGTTRTSHFNYATDEDTYIRGGKATSDVLLNDNGGNVGVGTAAPLSRLSISPSDTEAKITLWDGGSTTSHYGFGVSGGQLNYHVGSTSDTHVFYASGKNGNGTELMRIQGNGTVGIGTSTPFATSRLHAVSRDLYGGVFINVPTTALSQTEAVHAEVFTTQSIANAVGVFGQSVSGPNGEYGTGGRFRGSVGVQGESSGGGLQLGGRFTGLTGASATGISTTAAPAYGLFAQAGGSGSGSKFAVYGFAAGGGGTKYAGYFDGDVYVAGNLGKAGGTFRIDHPQDPENKYLVHAFVESPEMLNVYRGHVITDAQGRATATLPAYFEAENVSFEYHLTAVGQFAQVIVAEEVHGNQFSIATDKPNVKVSWQVTGARQDKWAQTHPINPEEPKTAAERGHYLLPELYGRPASEGIAPPPTSATPDAAGKMPTAGAPAASIMVR